MTSIQQNSQDQQKPMLLDQVRSAIRVRYYNIRTGETYFQWVKRFILYHNKHHPTDMGSREISESLSHLAMPNVAASTQNQAFSTIVFLYKAVLHRDHGEFADVIWAKKSRKLPVVLTLNEVKLLLDKLSDEKWIMAKLLYGAGIVNRGTFLIYKLYVCGSEYVRRPRSRDLKNG